jgi:hypothetical protein
MSKNGRTFTATEKLVIINKADQYNETKTPRKT